MRALPCSVIGLALFAACSKATETGTGTKAGAGWYRAVVGEKQGTAIPFFLQLPATGDAIIASGPDRVHARYVRGPNVDLEFDMMQTWIAATVQADGSLDGAWSSRSKTWGVSSLSFHAAPIAGPDPALRFPSSPGPDPSGVWKVVLSKQTDTSKLTLARGSGGEVTATLAFPTGNVELVAGNQDGKTIRMSAFDGSSPYLLVVELDDTGTRLTGTWSTGQSLDWKDQLTAQRTSDFILDHPTKLASERPMSSLPQLKKPPYAGHPVIVELGGSWCPACGHATTKLRELRDKYAANGLQVVMLAYEFTDDPVYNKQAADAFKAAYHLPWEVIPVDGGLEKYNEILPPEVESIDASGFPITIFVARDGGVEGFHAGFPAELWGTLHDQVSADYDRLAAKIAAAPTH